MSTAAAKFHWPVRHLYICTFVQVYICSGVHLFRCTDVRIVYQVSSIFNYFRRIVGKCGRTV